MRALLGETDDLVLDRWAIARSDAFDDAAIKWRAVECAADDLVGALGRVRDPAADLARMLGARSHERKHRGRIVAGLLGECRIIDRAPVDARRRAGLEATDTERQFTQRLGE